MGQDLSLALELALGNLFLIVGCLSQPGCRDFPLYAVITINEKRNGCGPISGQNLAR